MSTNKFLSGLLIASLMSPAAFASNNGYQSMSESIRANIDVEALGEQASESARINALYGKLLLNDLILAGADRVDDINEFLGIDGIDSDTAKKVLIPSSIALSLVATQGLSPAVRATLNKMMMNARVNPVNAWTQNLKTLKKEQTAARKALKQAQRAAKRAGVVAEAIPSGFASTGNQTMMTVGQNLTVKQDAYALATGRYNLHVEAKPSTIMFRTARINRALIRLGKVTSVLSAAGASVYMLSGAAVVSFEDFNDEIRQALKEDSERIENLLMEIDPDLQGQEG